MKKFASIKYVYCVKTNKIQANQGKLYYIVRYIAKNKESIRKIIGEGKNNDAQAKVSSSFYIKVNI